MGYTICFDIGGTNIKSGLVHEGKIVMTDNTAVESNSLLRPILEIIDRVIAQYKDAFTGKDSFVGIGLALPCFVNSVEMKILSRYVKYTDAADIDLVQWANKKWGVPVFIENDAKAALLGEWKYGAGKGYKDLGMLTFGTGIGSAIVTEEKMLHGRDFIAGNLMGHSTIDYNGGVCNCGNIGCTEQAASSWSINDKIQAFRVGAQNSEHDKSYDFREIVEKVRAGDSFFITIFEDCMEAWGATVINMILAYNPEVIICGGGIMKSHDIIFPYFRNIMDRHGWINSDIVQLAVANEPDFAAILGLHSFLMENALTDTE